LTSRFVAGTLGFGFVLPSCGSPSAPTKSPGENVAEFEAVEAPPARVSPGCDSGVRAGFTDTARFPNIAACAGSWDEPGLGADGTGSGRASASSAAALCAEGWHICTSLAEVKRKTSGQGCAGAELRGQGFFAIADGVTQTPQCFTNAPVGVLGCGSLGAPAPSACAPLDRVSNPGCSALDAPWACQKNNEVWSLVKGGQAGGGVLCCEGAAPQGKSAPPSEPWAFASGMPFGGSGPSECGQLSLSTTNTEPWGDDAFRNVPAGAPSVVIVTFSQPITAFHVTVNLAGAKAYVTGFNVPPTRVSGRVAFEDNEVRLPKGVEEGTAVLSWIGPRADALSWVIGGKERATVMSNGYAVACE
jgi:hypothetical protein